MYAYDNTSLTSS